MLDDIDYSALQTTSQAPEKKSGVTERSVVKKQKLERKPINEEALAQKASSTLENIGDPQIPDPIVEYALPAMGVLGGLAAVYGLWKKGQANANFPTTQAPDISVPADQKGQAAVKSVETNVAQSADINRAEQAISEQRLNLQDVIERTKAVNAPVAPPAPSGPTYNVPTAAVPQIGVQAPAPATVQAPMGAVAPAPVIPTVTEAVVTGESPAQAIKADLAQQIDNTPAGAVAPKKGRPAGAKNLTPEERLARKGVLPGMTPEQASMRNYLLGTYGGKENPAALQAYEIVKDILGYPPAYPPGSKGGGLAPEETGKILQYRKENIPGPKVNLTRDMKTVLKRGGPAAVAALVLTPEFAKASTEEQRQLIGEALTPMAMTPTTAEAPGVPESRFEQSALLGSPYAQTEWAKEKRKAIKGAAIPR